MTDDHGHIDDPVLSEFADDPDMSDLVVDFVGRMPERVNALKSAFDAGDTEQVMRLAHQLKGSGGGYGFPLLTTVSGELEQRAKEASGNIEDMRTEFDAVLDVCQRMAA